MAISLRFPRTGANAFRTDVRSTTAENLSFERGHPLPTAFNIFMSVDVRADGSLVIAPPRSHAGDSLIVRAEMDLAIAVSSCPASSCNGGAPPQPLALEVLRDLN